jgi:hypothetical protein
MFILVITKSLLRCFSLYSLGSDRKEKKWPPVLLMLRVYSLPINDSLVWWYKSVFTVSLPDSGWRLLLTYSVMSQRKESSSSTARGERVSPFSPQISGYLIIFLVFLNTCIIFLSVDNIKFACENVSDGIFCWCFIQFFFLSCICLSDVLIPSCDLFYPLGVLPVSYAVVLYCGM